MSGECEKCGEHYLDCICGLLDIKVSHTPVTFSLDKEEIRKKFLQVFKRWDDKLWGGLDEHEIEEFLDELMQTI